VKELIVRGYSLAETYHKALKELYECGEVVECPDWGCKQLEASMTMIVNQPLSEPMISRCAICSPESLEQYRQELLYGIMDFNIGKGWDYTYHDRITNYYVDNQDYSKDEYSINQVKFVIEELKRNPYSRRAVIDIRDNSSDCFSNDPACLQHIQYFIRNGKLDCCVLFRSNDATRANFMNCFGLIALQSLISIDLNIGLGTFTLRANSFHCYEQEFETLKHYVDKINKVGFTDKSITFNYSNDWLNKMLDSKPVIDEKVRKLRGEK